MSRGVEKALAGVLWGSAFGLTLNHSLLEGGWMSRCTNDLSSSSSHGAHHRPSLWYIGDVGVGGQLLGRGCSQSFPLRVR